MKIAVSIPDPLFERADGLAQRLGKSRSQLYREALSDYLDRRDPGSVTTALNEVVSELGDDDREWSGIAARDLLERSEW